MTTGLATNAATAARPEIEVRQGRVLFKRISPSSADVMVRRGWAYWVGTGSRRWLALTEAAPLSWLPTSRDGTRPIRADQSCKHHAPGQVIGHPRANREFIPR